MGVRNPQEIVAGPHRDIVKHLGDERLGFIGGAHVLTPVAGRQEPPDWVLVVDESWVHGDEAPITSENSLCGLERGEHFVIVKMVEDTDRHGEVLR